MKSEKILNSLENIVPQKPWFTLKEVCLLKNLGYKNSCTKKFLQPNGGIPDGVIGGKKMWMRSTVIDWILKTDEELEKGGDSNVG